MLVWEEPGSRRVNLAWRADDEVMRADEPEGSYGSLVLPALERRSFQASDAAADRGRVVALTDKGFRYRECRPLDEALRARFDMRAVQSWPLEGELIQGRLFALDKKRMQIDELVIGELVARLAVSRLDSLYFLQRLGEAAALEERVRLARDLHDSLLQSQAGAALQLLAARRLLERDSTAGKERLAEVQQQLERGRARDAVIYPPPATGGCFCDRSGEPALERPARGAAAPRRTAMGCQGCHAAAGARRVAG